MIKLQKFCMSVAVALAAGVAFAVDVCRNDMGTAHPEIDAPNGPVVTAVPGGVYLIVR